MKKSHRWAILAIVVSLGGLIPLAVAQNPGPMRPAQPAAGGGPRIAVLDVTTIFKTHSRLKLQLEDMKRDFQAAQNKFQAKRNELNKMATEGLATVQKGTPQYAEMEEQLANGEAQLAVEMNRQKNEFLRREATIYHNVYQEIMQATDYFCRQNSIDVVLQFRGDKIDIERPDTVLAQINRQVVWFDPGLDITQAILRDVDRPAANNPATTGAERQAPSPFRK